IKIICIADTHADYRQLKVPDGDILIHAGDVGLWEEATEIVDFTNWLANLPHKYKIVIAGNHDKLFSTWSKEKIRSFLPNIIYLENEQVTIEGLKIWGSPMSPTFGNWFFMADRGKEIQKYWDSIPDNLDVLITHSPPYDILDEVPIGVNPHVGCFDLLKTVKKKKPKYHIFGHIHNAYGIEKIEETTFVNCSVMDEGYYIVNKPVVLEV
ncbi:hypothetical protein LCGC14_1593060, partial [marine sediment metagenome]